MRGLLKIDYQIPKGMRFKIADSINELEQAYSILYESFIERGYINRNDAEIRLTKYHAIPGTMVLIALLDDEVIGTLSVIPDSPLGLPLESTWDIGFLRHKYVRIAELSALAVKKGHRSSAASVMIHLYKFMIELCRDYVGIEVVIASHLDKVKDYYRAFFLSQPIDNLRIKRYEFAGGVLAVAQYLDLLRLPENFARVYGKAPLEKNLFHFICHTKMSEYEFPIPSLIKCLYPSLTLEMLAYFFRTKTKFFESMSPADRQLLFHLYHYPEFADVIGASEAPPRFRRKEPRHLVNCKGALVQRSGNSILPVHLIDVTATGLGLRVESLVSLGVQSILNFKDSAGQPIRIEVVGVWQRDQIVGCQIVSVSNLSWHEFIDQLDQNHRKSA